MKKIYTALCMCLCCLLVGCGNIEDVNEKMTNCVNNEIVKQFNDNELINDFAVKDIKYEVTEDWETGMSVKCRLYIKSKELEKYADTNKDDKETIDKLLNIFRHIFEVQHNLSESQYLYELGKREIYYDLFLSDNYRTMIIIKDTAGNSFRYEKDESTENLWINNSQLYIYESAHASEDDSSSGSSLISYTGSYDAKLAYGSGSVLICISEDAMDRYMTAINKGYQGTIDEMTANGEIAYTEKNTKCNIVDKKMTKAKVELLDGSYAGNTVWVIIESLQEESE